jgi:catechol 2,3-dioxygenase-like lactoylglutathione lyase family enzyme
MLCVVKRIYVVPIGLLAAQCTPAPSRPPITGIAYVRIYAKDPAASQRFYTQEIRLPQAPCPTPDCARYQVGPDQYIEVVRATDDSDGMRVIGFRTTDAERLRSYLAAHHVNVPVSVSRDRNGDRAFDVIDAEGHHVAFVQPKAPADRQGAISHRLIHAGFVVRDTARMDAFYRDVLGFRPYWHGGMQPGRTDWVSLQVPDGRDWLEYMLHVAPDASHHLLGVMNHISLGVENMDSTEALLEATGWTPHGEEHKQMGLDGKYQLNVFDPDDVRVEFMAFTPSQQPCCSPFTGPHPTP